MHKWAANFFFKDPSPPFIFRSYDHGIPTTISERFQQTSQNFIATFQPYKKTLKIYYFNASETQGKDFTKFSITIEEPLQQKKYTTTAFFNKLQPAVIFKNTSLPVKISISPLLSEVTQYAGIFNLGLTCYISSSLQVLRSIGPFVDLVFKQSANNTSTTYFLQRLLASLSFSVSPVSIHSFIKSFGRQYGSMISTEQDVEEFITDLFNRLDEENGQNFSRQRQAIFGVTTVRVIKAKDHDVRKLVEETSSDIQVPVANFSSLTEALKMMTNPETISNWDSGSEFGKCSATQYCYIKNPPPILFFHLQRTSYDYSTQRPLVIDSNFQTPFEFNISNFSSFDWPDTTGSLRNNYILISIIAHRGIASSGHYIALSQPEINGHWFLFNDTSVSECSVYDIKDTFGGKKFFPFFNAEPFLSYFVAYCRADCVKNVAAHLKVPSRFTFSLISSKFFIFKGNHEPINPFILEYSQDIISIRQFLERSNDDEIIENIDSCSIYVEFPSQNELIGPYEPDIPMSAIALPGFSSSIYFIPKEEANNPIFIYKNNRFDCVSSQQHLEEHCPKTEWILTECPKEFTLHSQTDDAEKWMINLEKPWINFYTPFIVPLKINGRLYNIPYNSSYYDLQKIIDPENPTSILFYANNTPQIPPLDFSDMLKKGTIEAIHLFPPASINSISMLISMTIYLFPSDHHYEQLHRFWISRNSSCNDFLTQFRTVPQYSDKHLDECTLILSLYSSKGIFNIFETNQSHLVSSSTFMMRIDALPNHGQIMYSIIDFQKEFNDGNEAYIEVRRERFSRDHTEYEALGFWKVNGNMTCSQLRKKIIDDLPDAGIRNIDRLFIIPHIECSYQEPIAPSRSISQIFTEISQKPNWKPNYRPVFLIFTEEAYIH